MATKEEAAPLIQRYGLTEIPERVLILMAMKEEAAPLIQRYGLTEIPSPFPLHNSALPFVAYDGVISGMQVFC